jgi:hypothetical protein
LLQIVGEGDDRIDMFSCNFYDAPTTAFLCKFNVVDCDAKNVLTLFHEFSKRKEWDKGTLHPDSKCLVQGVAFRNKKFFFSRLKKSEFFEINRFERKHACFRRSDFFARVCRFERV